jgi:PKHD-type hydroxylase
MDESNLLKENASMVNFYFFRNAFDDESIHQIKELSKNYPVVDGSVSGAIDKSYRNSEITWIPYNTETKWIYEKCKCLAISANNAMWNFHITTVKESLQLSEYKASQTDENHGHYDWHMDFGGQSSTRKLSMSIQLTDPGEYEGGDIEFMLHRQIIKAPKTKGTVIMFPSYLTHRVTKVTSGTRNSLVTWFHGPPFI